MVEVIEISLEEFLNNVDFRKKNAGKIVLSIDKDSKQLNYIYDDLGNFYTIAYCPAKGCPIDTVEIILNHIKSKQNKIKSESTKKLQTQQVDFEKLALLSIKYSADDLVKLRKAGII